MSTPVFCCGCERELPPGQAHAAWCEQYRTHEGITLDEHWQRRGYASHAARVAEKLCLWCDQPAGEHECKGWDTTTVERKEPVK